MGFHWPELIIITMVALLVFGPKRLPEMGSAAGKAFSEFKRAMRELTEPAHAESAPADDRGHDEPGRAS